MRTFQTKRLYIFLTVLLIVLIGIGIMFAYFQSQTKTPTPLDDFSTNPQIDFPCSDPMIIVTVWSPNGDKLACGSELGTVDIWNTNNWQHIAELQMHEEWTYAIAWSPDEKYIASIGKDDKLLVFNTETLEKVISFDINILDSFGAGFGSKVRWNSSGSKLASIPFGRGRIQIWDMTTSAKVIDYPAGLEADWSSDGNWLATSNKNDIQVWDVNTSESLFLLKGHTNTVEAVQWSPDNRMLASASADGTVRIWEMKSDLSLKVFRHSNPVVYLMWSPDSSRLATVTDTVIDNRIHIWDIATETELADIGIDQPMFIVPTSIRWSPDGKMLVADSRVNPVLLQTRVWIWIWNTNTGEVINTLKASEERTLSDPEWSPTGSTLLARLSYNRVIVWDAKTLTLNN